MGTKKAIIITDIKNNDEITIYDSVVQAAKALKVTKHYISFCVNRNKLVNKRYELNFLEEVNT